ncbi:amino acid transporter [Rhizophagus irregularis]|uniref:Amino acid/polyamine transporter I n=3 Tax=Rhizophagus irregularis TaxID=588596 RepID=U9TT72_RHIID|nr:amino acid/polyamine transporter I [Rhizophagus irregularis DAOM 181602=DAOM 197198]EXX68783.1 Mup3p [Rhizophagus irregularis DAOM 197198w]PKC09927.1 amino acid transporter [Rhizophagus irregularis]PKC66138.1 amino acid transporter [Rhizophagus irregularis]POG80160.1 amino acid/polyamine transporter I [Rhizophagus irregularis DAOM 181602=DAOM 197198]UZO01747.1 hypothetical protein OCT59_020258 [Rhizophagus irregularis]|eukprot:XP_025187026.1 amino acid/polyamine transporter I [Rhizophagus irregularis DAOM 181602=DAOM 197198]
MSGYEFFTSGAPRQADESAWKYHLRKLFTTKSLESFEMEKDTSGLKRTLSAFDLIMIGLGGIIGTGILIITGQAAATKAGPAVVISFIISGIAASFAALCYSELSSMIPVAGSAYTYVYATLGELAAWIIGWSLILEYAVGASTIAVGWSGYFVNFFDHFGIKLSPSWTSAPLVFDHSTGYLLRIPGAYINLPAFLLILFLTIILILGIKESATVNNIAVTLKVFVILLFVIVGITKINPKNYDPFIPQNEGSFSEFGITGILSASSVVFFAYIGFDSISTAAQEAKNPQRDLPIGIIVSLIICTILYVAVCVVLTGIVHYPELNDPAPVTVAINAMGMSWLGVIVDFGALAGLLSGILVFLMGQTRIFYAMAKDGLFFPTIASKIHPKYKTPHISTAVTGVICAIISSLLPIGVLAELTSVGTLLAFLLVNIGVLVLRITAPNAPRKFKVPGGPYLIPIIGALLDLLLLFTATTASLIRLLVWMLIGLVIYFLYGRSHSVANNSNQYMKNKELNG